MMDVRDVEVYRRYVEMKGPMVVIDERRSHGPSS